MPVDPVAPPLIRDLDRYDAVFFVSANAADRGLDAVAGYWPQWPAGVAVYAVGERTAAVLRGAALEVNVPARADSEGLLALPSLQGMQGRRCLIVRGEGGRTLLGDTLQARGAEVDVLELYRRALPADTVARWRDLCRREGRPDCVILTSPDALRHWQQVAGMEALQSTWLVVSPRMRAQAEAAGARVLEAEGAGAAAIVSTLVAATHGSPSGQ